MVGGIFSDQEKTFDFVNYNVLLSELKLCGITGIASALFKSYIKGRYQRVIIYNTCLNCKTFSKRIKLKYDVTQYSVRGCLPFLLCINDLPKTVNNKSQPVLFADDTSIIVTDPNLIVFKNDMCTVFSCK